MSSLFRAAAMPGTQIAEDAMRPNIEITDDKANIRVVFGPADVLYLPVEHKPNGRVAISAEGGFYHEAATVGELISMYIQGWEEENGD